MAFMETWDETFPSDNQLASLGADDIRGLTVAVRERLAIDHVALAIEGGNANIGHHNKATLVDQVADLLGAAGTVRLFGKTITGKVELFLVMADNTVIQLTSGGKLNVAALSAVLATTYGGTGSSADANGAGGVVVPTGAVNAANGAVILTADAKLPAVDGSLLTGISKISILSGTIANGATIPLPEGYSEGQCNWLVSHGQWRFNADQHRTDFGIVFTAIGTRVVTIQGLVDGLTLAVANYIIIGVK